MNCRKTQKLLSAYLDGELAGDDLQQVKSHISSCAACARLMAQYQQLETGYAVAQRPLPVDFSVQVMNRIAHDSEQGRRESAEMTSVWDWLFHPSARTAVAFGTAVAVFLVIAFLVTGELKQRIITQNEPKAAPIAMMSLQTAPALRDNVEAKISVTNNIISRVSASGSNLIVHAANPEAAAAITQVVAENCGGRVMATSHQPSKDGAVMTLRIQMPQNQVAEFRDSLLDTQASDDEAMLRKCTRLARGAEDVSRQLVNSNLVLPQQLVPSPLGVANKFIGATDSNAAKVQMERPQVRAVAPAMPAREESDRAATQATIEVEIRVDATQK